MVTYKLALADKVIEVTNLFRKTMERTALFHTEKAADFQIVTTEADIAREQEISAKEAVYEGLPVIRYSDEELESTATYRKIAQVLLNCGIAVFHGAVVAVGEEAYLFTAKSGTGKTTHVNLWRKYIEGAYIVNGDKPLLMLRDEKVYACGSPWAGKEGYYCKKIVPLKAICILERGETNTIERVQRKDVFPILMQQIYRDPAQMGTVMQLAGELGRLTALYRLSCNMEPEAALVSYRGMQNDI